MISVQLDQNLKEEESNSNSGDLKNQKKKYSVIPQEVREKFIKRVISHEVTIKEAAKEFGIKFSTSKAILQTFKREGRIGKKKSRQRKPRIMKKFPIADKQGIKQSKVVPVVLYKTNNSISKPKNENQTQQIAASNPQNGYNSPSDIDLFDPEMKSTIQEIYNQLPNQNLFMSPQLSFSPYMGCYYPPQYQPQMYYNYMNNNGFSNMNQQFDQYQGMQTMKNEFQNPFVSQGQQNIQQNNIKQDEPLDLSAIRNTINALDVEKIRLQASQYSKRKEEIDEQQEFNYGYYFD